MWKIVMGDISTSTAEVIVTPTGRKKGATVKPGSSTAAIYEKLTLAEAHRNAIGEMQYMDAECRRLSTRKTEPFAIIYTCVPRWIERSDINPKELLNRTYKNIFDKFIKSGYHSIALPLLGTGTYNYPAWMSYVQANTVAVDYIEDYDISVFLYIYDKETMDEINDHLTHIYGYIDERIITESPEFSTEKLKEDREYYKKYSLIHDIDVAEEEALVVVNDAILHNIREQDEYIDLIRSKKLSLDCGMDVMKKLKETVEQIEKESPNLSREKIMAKAKNLLVTEIFRRKMYEKNIKSNDLYKYIANKERVKKWLDGSVEGHNMIPLAGIVSIANLLGYTYEEMLVIVAFADKISVIKGDEKIERLYRKALNDGDICNDLYYYIEITGLLA